jgi:hypothetical protein
MPPVPVPRDCEAGRSGGANPCSTQSRLSASSGAIRRRAWTSFRTRARFSSFSRKTCLGSFTRHPRFNTPKLIRRSPARNYRSILSRRVPKSFATAQPQVSPNFLAFFSGGHTRSPVSTNPVGECNTIRNRWFSERLLDFSGMHTALTRRRQLYASEVCGEFGSSYGACSELSSIDRRRTKVKQFVERGGVVWLLRHKLHIKFCSWTKRE